MIKKYLHTLLLFLTSSICLAQTAIVKGLIRDSEKKPIEGVFITYDNSNQGAISDGNGLYTIIIPAKQEIVLEFSHVSYNNLYKMVKVPKRKTFRYSPIMTLTTEEINEVTVQDKRKEARGVVKVKKSLLQKIPTPTPGVEGLLMTFSGVNNNNELSTQYSVRGGNFDENLVYVNGIEVYRPFLVRSGQQEGLSFVNSDMVQNIDFSAGGFQAKYGDRLSSVLDITYRKPTEMATTVDLNFMGGSVTFESPFFNKKLSTITSVRFRDNSLFVNSKDTEVNYRPLFVDAQTYLSYKFNSKWNLDFLGNISINNYNYKPLTRRTTFGTISNPQELVVVYQGNENDRFETYFGAFSASYQHTDDLKLTLTASAYNTQEEEYFDIIGAYSLNETNTDPNSPTFGETEFSQGIGGQLNHSRNDLDALIQNIQLKLATREDDNFYELSMKVQREDIRERINEWEVVDSTGFSLRPIDHPFENNQPETPYTGPIEPFRAIKANNNVVINRFFSYAQWSRRGEWRDNLMWYNFGVRSQVWNVTTDNFTSKTQYTFSPRGQIALKPDWEKDMLFRVSGGYYHQPPMYKELKNYEGQIEKDVKAQQSIHFVAGNEYSFTMWNRPFKLTSEIYFKRLTNVNAYSVDNVRIRYRADNVTEAKAQGVDFRLNGEFVPGNESWVSLGFLSTQENIDGRGYIPRPTDQRFKLGILFQDYVPALPDLKVYLNLVYNSGLPGGAPAYSDPYEYQSRLPDYKRADVGFSYVIVDAKKKSKNRFFSQFKQLNAGIQIFNVFDIQNSNTNTWVRDAFSKRAYAVPNYMTSRVINARLVFQF